ncbi:Retrovirus-related Pol polyprotein from transposon [Dictyocoela muelleri]|nr:Retrovirus-related Pol polyprotein from transposon [Dictyocoela muelleri]
MQENSIIYTSFLILNEQYEYLRMPFGLTNEPRSFQRIILRLLSDLNYVKVYLDDILIHSSKIEEHEHHILEVCRRLNDEGLSINIGKSQFFKEKIKYLGHYISSQGYFPRVDKLNLYRKLKFLKQSDNYRSL